MLNSIIVKSPFKFKIGDLVEICNEKDNTKQYVVIEDFAGAISIDIHADESTGFECWGEYNVSVQENSYVTMDMYATGDSSYTMYRNNNMLNFMRRAETGEGCRLVPGSVLKFKRSDLEQYEKIDPSQFPYKLIRVPMDIADFTEEEIEFGLR